MHNPLVRQLPVHSPLGLGAVVSATVQALRLRKDPRPELRALIQTEYMRSEVFLCGSGKQALAVAINEAFRRRPERSLLALPAFSCFDIATAAIAADARVILYDLDPETLAPELGSFERALAEGGGVAVVAPLYGIPVDWPMLKLIADRHGAILIEDAAQGHGARWNTKPLGALGDIAVLSFGRGKGWTGGEGGALLGSLAAAVPETVDEPGLAKGAAIAAGVIAQFALARPSVYQIPCSIPGLRLGETIYVSPRRLRALSREAAAALLSTHTSSEREGELRRCRADELLARLPRQSLRRIVVPSAATPGYLRLPVRLHKGMASFQSPERALRLGIAPSYPLPLGQLPALAGRISGNHRDWPGAATLVRELVTLPTHSRVDRDDVGEIVRVLTAL